MSKTISQRLPNFAKVAIAILEARIEPIIGEEAIKEIKAPLKHRELENELLEAARRAESRLIAQYPDKSITDALRELTIADLPSVKTAIWIFYDNPTDASALGELEKQIKAILPQGYSQDVIVSAARDYLCYLWEEMTSLPGIREKLSAISTLRTERNTSEMTELLRSIDKLLSGITDKNSSLVDKAALRRHPQAEKALSKSHIAIKTPKRYPAPMPPPDLIEEIKTQNVVPFIGAGLSIAARMKDKETPAMPSYRELLEKLLEISSVNPSTYNIIRDWLDCGEDDKAASTLREAIRDFDFYRGVRNILQPIDTTVEPSPAHKFLRILDFRRIITTNYDRLLEKFVGPEHEVITTSDLKAFILFSTDYRRKFILKLHGDISRPETIYFGYDNLKKLYRNDDSASTKQLRRFLEDVFSKNTVLFLGSSLGESEGFVRLLEELVEESHAGPIRTHYALVPFDERYEELHKSLTRRIGVEFLVYYPDEAHSQVWEFIASLNTGQKTAPIVGNEWEQCYLASQRADYLERQLAIEKTASAIYYLTPTLTNAIATDVHIREVCCSELRSKLTEPNQEMEQYIDDKVIPAMFARRDNLLERLRGKGIEVRVLFLKDELDKSFTNPSKNTVERYKLLLGLIQSGKLRVRLIPNLTTRQLREYEATYALIFSNEPKPEVDIAVAYASQATVNYFEIHMIQINTREVSEKVTKFERFWNSAWDEENSERYILDLIKDKRASI